MPETRGWLLFEAAAFNKLKRRLPSLRRFSSLEDNISLTTKSPTHIYNNAGIFNVILTAIADGSQNIAQKTIQISP